MAVDSKFYNMGNGRKFWTKNINLEIVGIMNFKLGGNQAEEMGTVLVCCAGHNEVPQTEWFKQQKYFVS